MAAIPFKVVDAFERGEVAKQGAFTSDGLELRSYDMLIAYRNQSGKIEFAERLHAPFTSPSVTTSRHLSACIGLSDGYNRQLVKRGTEYVVKSRV